MYYVDYAATLFSSPLLIKLKAQNDLIRQSNCESQIQLDFYAIKIASRLKKSGDECFMIGIPRDEWAGDVTIKD